MFDRFLVATDLSPATLAVVRSLGGLRFFGATQCLLLQCISMREGASLAYSYQSEPVERGLIEQKAILETQGFTVEARSVLGSAKHEVNRIAVEEDYALIVVGSQGQSLVAERMLGSVAYGIISHSRTPVLVLPIETMSGDDEQGDPVIRGGFSDHIVFATDFSDSADNAFTFLEQMVAQGVKTVTLLHVQDKSRISGELETKLDEFNRVDRERLNQLEQRLNALGNVDIRIEIRHGVPNQEIVDASETSDVSMIVMGTQGRGFFGEVFLGSVAAAVARRSRVPALFVPLPR